MKNEHKSDIYVDFTGHDRFGYPDNFARVTAGYGGESILVFGSEKTALYDCGMAYCHEGLIKNIEAALKTHRRSDVDCILMSHTHYDHIGALPYILKRWPDAVVYGSAKASEVFQSEGAKTTMKKLGESARDGFTDSKEPITTDGLRVDKTVGEGDKIAIGDEYFNVIETKGHTDCSLTYVLEPQSIMFASESTGVLRGPEYLHTAILKSYGDTIESAAKCKAYGPRQVISPHYGIMPEYFTDKYFDMYKDAAEEEKNYILGFVRRGLSEEEILEKHIEKYWSEKRGRAQPKAAYLTNAKITIKLIMKEFK